MSVLGFLILVITLYYSLKYDKAKNIENQKYYEQDEKDDFWKDDEYL